MSNSTECCRSINEVSLNVYGFDDFTQYRSVQAVLGILYSLIFLLGMLGNLSIIANVAKRKRIRTVANMFLVTLSMAQIILCLTTLPITPITLIRKTWEFGKIFCKVFPLCQNISVLLVSLSLCCIATDRYRNIVHPTRSRWKSKTALFIIIFCLICATFINSPLMLAQKLIPLNDDYLNVTYCGLFCGEFGWNMERPHQKKIYGSIVLFIQFGLPVIVMTFCYWKILIKVKNDLVIGAYADRPQQAQAAARKRNIMRVLVLMVLAFVASWLPLALMNILRDFDVYLPYLDDQVYLSQLVAHVVAMTSVVWNPILYFWMSKSHRNALRRKITEASRRTNMVSRASFFLHRSSHSHSAPDTGDTVHSVCPTNRLSPLASHGRRTGRSRSNRHCNSLTSLTKQENNVSAGKTSFNSNVAKNGSPLSAVKANRRLSFDPFADINDDDDMDFLTAKKAKTSSCKKPSKSAKLIHRISKKDNKLVHKDIPNIVTSVLEEETQIR